MNKVLENFARQELKDGLAKLSEQQRELFKRMYGTNDGRRNVADAKTMSINDVVEQMPIDKLDRAMSQVQRSTDKLLATK